ncbi:hypothetical protein ACFY0R_42255 [Streptomyces sp. NPDC001633]
MGAAFAILLIVRYDQAKASGLSDAQRVGEVLADAPEEKEPNI